MAKQPRASTRKPRPAPAAPPALKVDAAGVVIEGNLTIPGDLVVDPIATMAIEQLDASAPVTPPVPDEPPVPPEPVAPLAPIAAEPKARKSSTRRWMKMTTGLSGPELSLSPGDRHEFDADEAERLERAGFAEPTDAPAA